MSLVGLGDFFKITYRGLIWEEGVSFSLCSYFSEHGFLLSGRVKGAAGECLPFIWEQQFFCDWRECN